MNAIFPLSLMRRGETLVSWTDEAIETVIRLSANGRSATEIANEMRAEHPGITRNSVIGKLHRMGCAGGGRQPNKERSALGKFMRTKSRAAPQIAAAPVQASAWITIVDLNESVCHFPAGNPHELETFRYCGASIGEGERYCGAHRRVMYQPAPLKRL
jgi:GcrA cell cycle regulator